MNIANSLSCVFLYRIFFTSGSPFGFISAGMIGAQYGHAGAMFILLMSEAEVKSSGFTSGFLSMYCSSWDSFLSLISIVHGSVMSAAVSPLNGHLKFMRPLIIAISSGLFFLMTHFFWV